MENHKIQSVISFRILLRFILKSNAVVPPQNSTKLSIISSLRIIPHFVVCTDHCTDYTPLLTFLSSQFLPFFTKKRRSNSGTSLHGIVNDKSQLLHANNFVLFFFLEALIRLFRKILEFWPSSNRSRHGSFYRRA